MSANMFIACVFGIVFYILMGFLLTGIIVNFTNMELENYVLASMLFWPIVLFVGAVFQLIHFIEAMFRGDY